MSFDIQYLRDEVREHLGLGDEISDADGIRTENWKDVNIDALINESFWEVSDKFPFRLKTATDTRTTTDGERRYSMPLPYEALKSISVVDPDTGKYIPLDRMSKRKYEEQYVDSADEEGQPTNYFREGDDYILFPTPDQEYELAITFDTPFDDLSDANDDPTDSVPRVWIEIVKLGAIWRGFMRQRNFVAKREVQNDQVRLINSTTPTEAKEEFDSSRAGLSVPEEWNSRRDI